MALTLVTSDLIHGLDYSKLTGTIPTWNQNTTGTAAGLSATLAVGSGGTGVTSITALKNVLDDETWTFANNANFSGNVGIGTTSPSATLHVNAPAPTAPSLTMGASAGQIFENEDLEFAFGLNNASPYNGWMQTRFNGNAARNFAINPLGGNVGIGTNSPGSKLDVLGKEIIIGSNNGDETARTNSTVKVGAITFPHYTNAEENVAGLLLIGTATTNEIEIGGGTGSYNAATQLRFFTSADNTTVLGTPKLSISSTGVASFSSSASNQFIINSTETNGGFINLQRGGANLGWIGSAYHTIAPVGLNTDLAVNSVNGNLILATSSTERMRISSTGMATFSGIVSINGQGFFRGDSSGNLRIQGGTTATEIRNNSNTSSLLTILDGGAAAFASPNTTANVAMVTIRSTDSQGANVGGTLGLGGSYGAGLVNYALIRGAKESSTYNDSNGYMSFTVHSSAGQVERMRISSGGSVKIGNGSIATPSTNAADLFIDNGDAEAGITIISTAASSLRFGDAANVDIGSIEYNHSSDYMRMIVNNSERMRITSGGDVQAKGTNLGITQSDGDYLAKLYQSGSDGFLSLYTGQATPVERVRLSSYSDSWIVPALATGKVGIGRTNPSSKLHLDGSNYNTASETQFTITDHGNNYNSGDTSCRIVMESRYWSGDDNVSTRSAITNIKDNSNGSSGSAMAFHTTNQGAGVYSEKLRIASNGDATFSRRINARTDNGSNVTTSRAISIAHGGAATFSYDFNPVTLFGFPITGGFVKIEAGGWSYRFRSGYIYFQNAGGSGNLTSVAFFESAGNGTGTISVGYNGTNIIRVTFSNWHTNGHSWYATISTSR